MITVDVKLSKLMDRIVFLPRKPASNIQLFSKLKDAFPKIKFFTSPQGISTFGLDNLKRLDLSSNIHLTFRFDSSVKIYLDNRTKAIKYYDSLYQLTKHIIKNGKLTALNYLPEFKEINVLDDHQVINIAVMTLKNGFGLCVFDEQGAGKTVTFIFAFDLLVARDEIDGALIVAPKSMVSEWPLDFEKFMGDCYKVKTLVGNRSTKMEILGEGADILITNYETIVSMERELTAYIRKFNQRFCLVVDESFFIKNLDTQRAQSIKRIREYCSRAFVLCGTPAPNKPQDLIEQFNLVDFGITFPNADISKFNSLTTKIVQETIDDKGLYVRHLKSKVLPNLPTKRFSRLFVDMQKEQYKLYMDTLNELVCELKKSSDDYFKVNIVSYLAKRNALLQICSNPKSIYKEYNETPAKLLALDNLLREIIIQRKEKVVLWSFYTNSIERILSRYKEYNPVRYDGKVNKTQDRREAIRKFKDDDRTMLFVGNSAAGGAGLNLQNARVAIYESFSNQAAHYLQSLDRIHRRGQQREVEYIILLCNNTIEVDEYNKLLEKERTAQDILGDVIEPPITRTVMLGQLLKSAELLGTEYVN